MLVLVFEVLPPDADPTDMPRHTFYFFFIFDREARERLPVIDVDGAAEIERDGYSCKKTVEKC